jgi:hypothetical protein
MRRGVTWALGMVAAAVAVGTALVYGQGGDAGSIEGVTLRSDSYADFRQALTREAPAEASIPAALRFPEQPRDHYPAVVVVHTISGFQRAGPQPVRGRRLPHGPAAGVRGGRRVRRAAISGRASAE